jgi:hypothetical protein
MRTSPDPLTQADLQKWDDEGWLLLRDAVPVDVIQRLRDLCAGVVDTIIDDLADTGVVEDKRSALPFETRLAVVAGRHANRYGRSWRNEIAAPAVYDLHHSERLARAIGQICRSDVIGHPVFNARPKLPGQQLTVVPWHQDSGYFGQESADSLIPTAWIPLVPVDASNGCIQVVPGSHRMGIVDHRTEEREGRFLEVDPGLSDGAEVVTCPMNVGDALLFHNLTLHRSTAHTGSETIRWAIDIRYLRDGDHPGAFYWPDPDFKWVIRSDDEHVTPLADWLEQWQRQ